MAGRKRLYPFGRIKVGGSRRFPLSTGLSIRQAAHNYGEKHGCRFRVKIYKISGVAAGFQVWRIR